MDIQENFDFAYEGIFDFMSNLTKEVVNIPHARVLENGNIEIRRLHWGKLNTRISKLYKEKNMMAIFNIRYRGNSKNSKKKKIDYIWTESFFALEVVTLFNALATKYQYKYYEEIAKTVYEKTWVSKEHDRHATTVDMEYMQNELEYKLRPFQKEFIEKYPGRKDRRYLSGYLLSFDQGLGKTLTSIGLSVALKKKLTIIICPNTLKGNWANEIGAYFKKYKNKELFQQEVYAINESKHTFDREHIKYLIINHESIPQVYKYLPSNVKDSMIIVDESHYFRNIEGKRANEMIELKEKINCNDNLLMSGTPIKALPNEMIPVMRMIDPLFTDKVANKYRKIFNVEGLNTSDIVKTRFSEFMWRKTKEEVLTLPERHFHDLEFTLPNSDRYTMSSVKHEVISLFKEYLNAELPKLKQYEATFLNLLNKYNTSSDEELKEYLRYIKDLRNMNITEDRYDEETLERLKKFTKTFVKSNLKGQQLQEFKRAETLYLRLKESCMGRALGKIVPKYRTEMFSEIWKNYKQDFIDKIKKNDKKTVIFSNLLEVVKLIANDLVNSGIGAVMIVGEIKDRTDIIKAFKQDDRIDVIVASSQTLATGVTLTEANQMFFFSTPWRDADFKQCTDRIYRIGQTSEVNIYTVLLKTDTINLSTRANKILKWSEEMFGGFVKSTDSEDTIAEEAFTDEIVLEHIIEDLTEVFTYDIQSQISDLYKAIFNEYKPS